MNTASLLAISCATSLAFFSAPCYAHGGQYRGPGDVVPPSPGGGPGRSPGGPTPGNTGQPGQPGAPVPTGANPTPPNTGGNGNGPSGSRPGQTGPRGIPLDFDLTTWDYWWEFNKDPYLRLKNTVNTGGPESGGPDVYLGQGSRHEAHDTLKPTSNQILHSVLPTLKRAIDASDNRDIISSCMVAMAKAGTDHPDFRLVDVFAPKLRSGDQEIRETAALSLGIAAIAGEREIGLLVALASDDPLGAQACARAKVDDRTRAFAAYGLGLMAYATTRLSVKQQAFAALRPLVDDATFDNRNIKVAAIHAISLLQLDGSVAGEAALQDEALQCLETYYRRDLGAGQQLIQSHCPTAIAKLIGRDHQKAGHYRELFAKELAPKSGTKRSSADLERSCVLALGRLCRPVHDANDPDGGYSKLLFDVFRDHRDAQTRNFAVLALGQIGGRHNREALLLAMGKAQKALEKPWFALALGVYAFRELESKRQDGAAPAPDTLIGSTLLTALQVHKEPGLRSALAIGLGLCHYQDGADTMRELMLAKGTQEGLAGYLCIGLALMEDRGSIAAIRQVVADSVRRQELFKQAAIALGRLGDKEAARDLQERLADPDANLAKLSAIASALGFSPSGWAALTSGFVRRKRYFPSRVRGQVPS